MDPRLLLPVAFVVALVPHALVVLAVLVRAVVEVVVVAVALGPHALVMIALTVAAATVLVLAQRIDALTMRNGWGLVRTARTAAQ